MNWLFFGVNVMVFALLISRHRKLSDIARLERQLDPVARLRKHVAQRLEPFLNLRNLFISGVTYTGNDNSIGWVPSEINGLIREAYNLHRDLTKEN